MQAPCVHCGELLSVSGSWMFTPASGDYWFCSFCGGVAILVLGVRARPTLRRPTGRELTAIGRDAEP